MLKEKRFNLEKDLEQSNQEEENKEMILEEAERELLGLGLKWEDLENKRVLNIGAGAGDLAKAAEQKGIKIISFDKYPERYQEEGTELPYNYIKGTAEKLPLKDASFDLVLCHAGPLTICPDKFLVILFFKEAERVLRPGGELRFGPGNLHAGLFAKDDLFSRKEDKEFTTEQRIERISEHSIEFLKKINPQIEKVPNEKSFTKWANSYYLFKK